MPIIDPNKKDGGTKLPAGVSQGRKSVHLEAYTGRGSLIAGKGRFQAKGRLTTTDGQPIADATLEFHLKGDNTLYDTVDTDPDGYAEYDTAQTTADVQGILIGGLSGYTIHFAGNPTFKAATAEGAIHVTA
ncbi:hypothetical protein [Streptomyces sp. NPDC059894]|uniref:hypothetical protein n=1 Tax=unclassified Streptomyces TaxID=2593676 RepID=UPI00364ABEDF